ncbi:MAG: dihydropteroate synthase [Planctomycetota bacterium]|nr:dihydropteroate synthase [Planctomycetota bacterium]
MIIIGEKINATRKAIAAALAERNEKAIIQTAVEQAAAGADFIDINGGDPREGMEEKNMAWLVELVQANTDKALAIDSADVGAMRKGLSLVRKKPILNSISLESDRLGPMLPIVAEHDCMVVALLMSDEGTPCRVDDRLHRAEALIAKAGW